MQCLITPFAPALPVLFNLFLAQIGAPIQPQVTLQSRSTGRGYAICGSCTVPQDVSSTLWLVAKDEPGDPVVLSGIIYKEDGVTPYPGVTLFLYQADAGGYYHRPKEDVFHPRIYGWLRTGNDGHYLVHTVKPAPEILAAQPAHIHVHIFGNGMPEHFLHEFWFDGDPHISTEDIRRFAGLGKFSPMVALSKGRDGIWTGIRNIRVRPAPPWRYEND